MPESKIIKKKVSKKLAQAKSTSASSNKDGSKGQGSDVSSSSSESAPEEEGSDNQIGKGVAAGPVVLNREEYLQAHRDLTFDKHQAQTKNNILHRRLADYYKKRKLEHVLKPLEGVIDIEEKYNQKLLAYDELKTKEEREVADIKAKLHVVIIQYYNRREHAEAKFEELQHLERTTGTGLIYSKKGKPIADKTVHRLLTLQKRKTEQSSALCLRYIRVRNAVAELEAIVRKLEQIAPGLYVRHYEQLYIDHQNYITKTEEREDDLIKNRNKCTEHNQILAHIREKMHHTDEVIDFTECDFGEAEMEYQRAREDLGNVKSCRDRLRWSLEAERRKAGLLTRKDLLRDYENATDQVETLRKKKGSLERQIAKISKELKNARLRMQISHSPSAHTENSKTSYYSHGRGSS